MRVEQHIAYAIDTSDAAVAEERLELAADFGLGAAKVGVELESSLGGWEACGKLASKYGLPWIADVKYFDIPESVERAVRNHTRFEHPPLAITMHIRAGHEAMQRAQEAAGDIKILGVTKLTSEPEDVDDDRPRTNIIGKRVSQARAAGLAGVVLGAPDLGVYHHDMFTLVPGIRLMGSKKHEQKRTGTPETAIRSGATMIVAGRTVYEHAKPELRMREFIESAREGLW